MCPKDQRLKNTVKRIRPQKQRLIYGDKDLNRTGALLDSETTQPVGVRYLTAVRTGADHT